MSALHQQACHHIPPAALCKSTVYHKQQRAFSQSVRQWSHRSVAVRTSKEGLQKRSDAANQQLEERRESNLTAGPSSDGGMQKLHLSAALKFGQDCPQLLPLAAAGGAALAEKPPTDYKLIVGLCALVSLICSIDRQACMLREHIALLWCCCSCQKQPWCCQSTVRGHVAVPNCHNDRRGSDHELLPLQSLHFSRHCPDGKRVRLERLSQRRHLKRILCRLYVSP